MIWKISAAVLLFSVSALAQSYDWVPVDSYQSNQESQEALRGEQFQKGLESSVQGLASDPFRFEHHMNLALSLQGIGDLEQALKAFESAKKYAQSPQQKFLAAYNLGQILGQAKKVDEALAAYQEALDINPASIETKHNIELLIQSTQGGGQGKDKNNQGDQGDQNQDQQKDSEGDKDKEDPKKFADNPPPQKQPFQGKEISEADAKKILDELGRQERRIRSEFHKKGRKESPRDKDW